MSGEAEGAKVEPAEAVISLFESVQQFFENEQDVRERIRLAVKDLEQSARGIFTCMQAVHQCTTAEMAVLCVKSRAMFEPVRTQFATLVDIVPANSYYRFHDHWRFVMQRLAFLGSLLVYLESGRLATRYDVASIIGVCVRREEGFHIDLDDFLMGLLSLASELSRLAVNSVVLGDCERPFAIAGFVSELAAGFRLLNLKNDALRRKHDALKYDVKKIEEVVYDISIRGLKPAAQQPAETALETS